ncbi:hypothetical protein E3T54_11725 [Cryobacterium sp. Sr8]|uniref:hypothetical protein n=1 Tax=Cryobacterium sp. Sr8 TaxID=1259203 RepID=UPI00106A327F|nr:hypothetical protein [Cryobacterium sp. Sr8]TFD75592.1 hypothetical protein E3T54_11725 [Cryobacterium sp. Sr8]
MLHRLVGANDDGSLITAGDANADVDSTPLDRLDILSQARLLIPWIGLPAFWATTGAFLPLGIWVVLTAGAILITATNVVSPLPHTKPWRPSRPGRGPKNPGTATQDARAHGNHVLSLVTWVRTAAGPPAVALAVLITAATLAMAPLGQATAAFSAKTSTVGNTWKAGASATKLAFSTQPSGSTGGIPSPPNPW